jgi:hypothetical protein
MDHTVYLYFRTQKRFSCWLMLVLNLSVSSQIYFCFVFAQTQLGVGHIKTNFLMLKNCLLLYQQTRNIIPEGLSLQSAFFPVKVILCYYCNQNHHHVRLICFFEERKVRVKNEFPIKAHMHLWTSSILWNSYFKMIADSNTLIHRVLQRHLLGIHVPKFNCNKNVFRPSISEKGTDKRWWWKYPSFSYDPL